jgi:hypothetical protein
MISGIGSRRNMMMYEWRFMFLCLMLACLTGLDKSDWF